MSQIKKLFFSYFLLSSLAIALWFIYEYFVVFPNREIINKFFVDYDNNFVESPIKYRVLVTEFVLYIAELIKTKNYIIIYSSTLLVIFIWSLFQLQLFFELVYRTTELQLVSVFLSFVFIIVSFTFHYYQPWSYLDLGLYSFFYRVIFFKKKYSLSVLILFTLVILNRETGIFIGSLYLIDAIIKKQNRLEVINSLMLILYGILILASIRYCKGYSLTNDISRVNFILNENISKINLILLIIILFSSGMYLLLFCRSYFRIKLNSAYINLLLFIPLYLVYGIWIEIRMLLPFLPILILPIVDLINQNLFQKTIK